MTYSENLQARAEEMAKTFYEGSWDDIGEHQDDAIEAALPLAAMCLQKEAEAYEVGFKDGCENVFIDDQDYDYTGDKKEFMQRLGLIEKE